MSCSDVLKKYSEWLEKEVENGNISLYKYSLFKNIKYIRKGGFGFISSADYYGGKVALKSINTKEATRDFVNEILNKISEETKIEEFIINRNQRPIPTLTGSGASSLFSVGQNIQIINDPNLKKSSQNQDDRYEESLSDLSKSVELDSNNSITLLSRGKSYFMLEKYNESIKSLTELLDFDPENVDALNTRAKAYCKLAYYELCEFKNSLKDLNEALNIDPNDEESLRCREQVQLKISNNPLC
ncbi:21047_t:CDS:2 [Cetraspora pellucida]|uniref:peptidylprolyl isomerase n=1 Tax=Cetraspora pellucida TaxID=1433469 RepID=A0A9N8VXA0_9GLOM|nr:21047_t:CDS:2 [Cetraspora pellucida]